MSDSKSSTKKASEVLAGLSAGKKSGWSERARKRQEDQPWLRQSRRIALHVLNALEAKGMSQKQLAEAVGVSPQYISKLVSGKEGENLSLKTIAKLEEALNTSLIMVCEYNKAASTIAQQATIVQRPTNEGQVFSGKVSFKGSLNAPVIYRQFASFSGYQNLGEC